MAWDAVPAAASYCLYHGTRSHTYTDKKCTPDAQTSLSWTLEVTAEGDYFAVTAVGSNDEESDFSNEVFAATDGDPDGIDNPQLPGEEIGDIDSPQPPGEEIGDVDNPQPPGEETSGIEALHSIINLLVIEE